jgi:hypothetical protein
MKKGRERSLVLCLGGGWPETVASPHAAPSVYHRRRRRLMPVSLGKKLGGVRLPVSDLGRLPSGKKGGRIGKDKVGPVGWGIFS